MNRRESRTFCITCKRKTGYRIEKECVQKTIRGKDYNIWLTTARCEVCESRVNLHGLIDLNVRETDQQYRAAEGIITIEEIQKIMDLYDVGKAPLSLVLGFGEITITRYLDGQVPSKEYSDILKSVLGSREEMRKILLKNGSKISGPAYRKAMDAVANLDELFGSVSSELLAIISEVFRVLNEVTPLALQKILYYVQGLYIAKYNVPAFPEHCEAWIHGPVYRNVFKMFREFKYSPIEDSRFAMLENLADEMPKEKRELVDLVLNTVGIYNGKYLEEITHKEDPWKNARQGCLEDEPSAQKIDLDDMKDYFVEQNKKYDLYTEKGMRKYLRTMYQR